MVFGRLGSPGRLHYLRHHRPLNVCFSAAALALAAAARTLLASSGRLLLEHRLDIATGGAGSAMGPDCTYTSAAGFTMGQCVTDGIGIHGNNERCTIAATETIFVTAVYFNVESLQM